MSAALEKRFGLAGKVALVTGAGKGIGRAVSLTLAEAGAAVAVQDLDGAAAGSVAEEIQSAGGKALALEGDAADQGAIEQNLAKAKEGLGRLDILVNNAGIYPFSDIPVMPVAEWDTVIQLNLRGTFLHTKFGGQIMADLGNGGRIINLASVQGIRPTAAGVAHYDVSKAGVIMLTKAAALEFAGHGIAINAVAPGIVETPGTSEKIRQGSLGDPADLVPLGGRWARTEEIADVILFLAGPAAAYITGETIIIDGGFLLK